MYPAVKTWFDKLPWWQQKVHQLMSLIGREETGYKWFGFYKGQPK